MQAEKSNAELIVAINSLIIAQKDLELLPARVQAVEAKISADAAGTD